MALEEDCSPILLTKRKEYLEQLHERLKGFIWQIPILRGGRSPRRDVKSKLDLLLCLKMMSGSFSRPDDTSEKDSMTPDSTPCFLLCQCPGKVRWCNMPAGCIDCIPANMKYGCGLRGQKSTDTRENV